MHIRFARLGVCFAFLIASSCGVSQTADEAGAQAQQLFDAGRYREASTELNVAVQRHGEALQLWLLLARTRMALKDFDRAAAAYSRAIELDQANTEALSALAQISLIAGKIDSAEEYAERLLALDPGDPRALLVKGFARLARQRNEESLQIANAVLEIEPRNESAVALKARALLAADRAADASALLESFGAAGSRNLDLLTALREVYLRSGDRTGSERVSGVLAKRLPGDNERQFDYALQLCLNGKPMQAAPLLDKLQRAQSDNPTIQERIAGIWLDTGILSARVHSFVLDTIRVAPGLRLPAARFAILRGDPRLAIEILGPALPAVSAQTAERIALFALAESALGLRAAAEIDAERVLAFDKTSPTAMLVKAQSALVDGRSNDSLRDARLLVQENPEMASARLLLARVFTARNEKLLARAALADAATDLPDNTDIMRNQAALFVTLGMSPDALRIASSFTRRNPDSIRGWIFRQDLCAAQRDGDCVDETKAALVRLRGVSPGVSGPPDREARAASKPA